MLNSSMNTTDVLRDYPAINHAIKHPEEGPQLVHANRPWDNLLLTKQPSFKEWMQWHYVNRCMTMAHR